MTILKHKSPCNQCPYRRASPPGWLGDSTPSEFMAQTLYEENHMPCHAAVDYEKENWRDKLAKAPHCAGSLIFMHNHCYLPRDPDLTKKRNNVEPDHEKVFSHHSEFTAHHNKFNR